MERIVGAAEGAIKKYLFIISPNNSGSNVLRSVLAQSAFTWNLEREGQHTTGFCGPSTRGTGARLIWASSQKWLAQFSDEEAYDWQKSRAAWSEQAYAKSPVASVFVTSSPPFLLQIPALNTEFTEPKFIFMVRNPYAAVEGICRRANQQILSLGEDIRIIAARHIMKCFEIQKRNIERFVKNGLFFSYETLCRSPDFVSAEMQKLAPEIADLDFAKAISVKGIYFQPLKNLNTDQISNFSSNDFAIINNIFSTYSSLLSFFGYKLITSK